MGDTGRYGRYRAPCRVQADLYLEVVTLDTLRADTGYMLLVVGDTGTVAGYRKAGGQEEHRILA